MNGDFWKKNGKKLATLLICLCLLSLATGTVWAYLVARSEALANEFVPSEVTLEIEEDFGGGEKKNVAVRNTGNIPAFIRAAVVATFVSDEGKVLAVAPKEGKDYTVVWWSDGWVKGADGFYYCETAVEPDALTPVLIQSAVASAAPEGYRLNLQILASAVQAEPASAVGEAWGVTLTDGKIAVQ